MRTALNRCRMYAQVCEAREGQNVDIVRHSRVSRARNHSLQSARVSTYTKLLSSRLRNGQQQSFTVHSAHSSSSTLLYRATTKQWTGGRSVFLCTRWPPAIRHSSQTSPSRFMRRSYLEKYELIRATKLLSHRLSLRILYEYSTLYSLLHDSYVFSSHSCLVSALSCI